MHLLAVIMTVRVVEYVTTTSSVFVAWAEVLALEQYKVRQKEPPNSSQES